MQKFVWSFLAFVGVVLFVAAVSSMLPVAGSVFAFHWAALWSWAVLKAVVAGVVGYWLVRESYVRFHD